MSSSSRNSHCNGAIQSLANDFQEEALNTTMNKLKVCDPINESDDSITPHIRLNEEEEDDDLEESSRNSINVCKGSKKRQEWNKALRNSCIDPVAFTLLNEKLQGLESLLEHDRLNVRISERESIEKGHIKDIEDTKIMS